MSASNIAYNHLYRIVVTLQFYELSVFKYFKYSKIAAIFN